MQAIIFLALSTALQAQQDSFQHEHPTKRLPPVVGNEGFLHQAHIPSSMVDAHRMAELSLKMNLDVVEEVRELNDSAEFCDRHFLPLISMINEKTTLPCDLLNR